MSYGILSSVGCHRGVNEILDGRKVFVFVVIQKSVFLCVVLAFC